MDIDQIMSEIEQYQPLKELHINGKDIGWYVLNKFLSKVPYIKERKRWELRFFYENIEFITKKLGSINHMGVRNL